MPKPMIITRMGRFDEFVSEWRVPAGIYRQSSGCNITFCSP
jgi:hypothetical protein